MEASQKNQYDKNEKNWQFFESLPLVKYAKQRTEGLR